MLCRSRLTREQRWKKKPNTLYVSLNSETAKIPTRATSGSAGLDTYASEGACIPAGGSGLVNTGISIEMPAGVYARIAPRSGLAVKNRIAVGGGVIDPDYDGEIKVILFNHGGELQFCLHRCYCWFFWLCRLDIICCCCRFCVSSMNCICVSISMCFLFHHCLSHLSV